MTESLSVGSAPYGWGPQPTDEWDSPWSESIRRCGDLRNPERIESGTRVVAASSGHPVRDASPVDPLWRGHFLAQCWCGRTVTPVEPRSIAQGETATCSYYRCALIAAMSPPQRVRLTPHRRASLSMEYKIRTAP